MQLYILSILWAMALVSTKGYAPRVTKSLIESPQDPNNPDYSPSAYVDRFGDSDTLMLALGGRLHISFDNGENWKPIDEIGQAVTNAYVDSFHQERGFVNTRSDGFLRIHVTEDQGRSWRKLAIPREMEENVFCHIITHPFDSDLLLLDCTISGDDEWCEIVYASNDAGKNFRHIVGAPAFSDDRIQCRFAASSKESTLESNGIYCIHTIDKTTSQVQYSIPNPRDLAKTSFEQEHQSVGALFYTADLGKTRKFFDELNGFSVEEIFVLPSCVAVVTSEGNYLRDNKLWISKGASFHLAHLPENVNSIVGVESFSGDDQGRLLLEAEVSGDDNREHGSTWRSLLSDSSGLNFSFWYRTPDLASGGENWISNTVNPSSLKGTLWGIRFFKESFFQRGSSKGPTDSFRGQRKLR